MLNPLSFQMLQVGSCRHPECVALRGAIFKQQLIHFLNAFTAG
jgi:hypothetical protein